jgi:hypothetical protein
MTRILVTGSRLWDAPEIVYMALAATIFKYGNEDVTIVHGGAKGADTIAGEFARFAGHKEEIYKANWKEFGRGAGPIRNQQMVDSGADLCLAFLRPGSKGTADCIKRAEKSGIPVKVYKEDNV